MLAIIARVELGSVGDADKYVELATPMVEPTREEKGCLLYAMARDFVDPKVIWISEQWETQEDLDTHLRTDHIKDFLAATADLRVVGMEPRQYEVSTVGTVIMPED